MSFEVIFVSSLIKIAVISLPGARSTLPCIGENRHKSMDEFFDEHVSKLDIIRAKKAGKQFIKTIYEDKNDFNCEYIDPSSEKPMSVRKLKPGDINLVAAIGDSLTAASGARASTILGISNAYKGLTFNHFTVPNALKFYNPNLKGFSYGIASGDDLNTALNKAVPGSKAVDLMPQAERLLNDLKTNPEYDFENDWKLVTVFVGGNNLCQLCTDSNSSPEIFAEDIKKTLDFLHENLPKTFVNLVTIFDAKFVTELGEGNPLCNVAHVCFCSCLLDNPESSSEASPKYAQLVTDLAKSGRYNTREDFAVVVQPFLEDIGLPYKKNGEPDLSYFAPDCFHFSQRGHNAAGKSLWNNMFEREKSRPEYFSSEMPIKCPTKDAPYLVVDNS
ncbi:phospholipase B1, membrane-associated-like [Symsagittifera roscoffensis]|uniref:phospholipase B1, membrane-associated-like n=1 Tax=Symsagittifera roscoffensis TaxID=84072 RepID=UPI00307C69B6